MTEPFDDADIGAAYGRLVANAEAPPDAMARVARRRVQRRRRRQSVVGLVSLTTLAALGIGAALAMGDRSEQRGEVAVDPATPDSEPVVQAPPIWPTEVTCDDGAESELATVDAPRVPLSEIVSGLGPVHFDRAESRLYLLRPDRSAHTMYQFFTGAAGMAQLSSIEECGEAKAPVETALSCPAGEEDSYITRASPVPETSAIEVSETWSGGNLVALSKDGGTAYAQRPDGSTYAVLSVMGKADAHNISAATYCRGEGQATPEPVDAGGWPTEVTCPSGGPNTVVAYSPTRYSTFTAFLRGEGTGSIHHSEDRATLFLLRPDGTAYRKIATPGAEGGWNPGKITACDFAERDGTPRQLDCPGPVVSSTLEYFVQAPPKDLSLIEAAEEYSDGRPVALAATGETVRVVRPDGTASAELMLAGDEATGYYVSGMTHCSGEPRPGRQR